MKQMKVFCVEGCHGVGKSSLLEGLQQSYPVLDEMFTDMPSYNFISSQSLPMEFIWVANWFQRLLKIYTTDYHPIVFADRSPYSAVYYSKSGSETQNQLKLLIKSMTLELKNHGIQIETICVQVSKNILWNRICQRLQLQQFRLQYNEDSYEWMEKTWQFFNDFDWDHRITNDEEIVTDLGDHLINKLQEVGIVVE
ncbi:Nucleoside/nucleotide_kinase [Hexamita inflata]|uniref:Nucleoside/nucleotide kinase n=1 Tax=Hexamita inflata TaxID=28002 RepID=A0AA86RDJ8_9EUKA|nr:Nucleoside/nucleotide kinase [Hexamita inflata]CAI9955749.1 Nucleoside/nucleotide kinase [Hexamita inflata]CAI9970489.1 Nucleoside/nucleotide kinase [Hexamita inflata]